MAAFAFLAACSPNTEENKQPKAEVPEKIAGAKHMDPVCEMERDASWTDYAVSGADTTWFCSVHCKDVYTAAPEKYKK